MATMRLDNATLSIGSVDLSAYASTISLDLADDTDETGGWATDRIAGLQEGSLTFSGYWDGPSLLPDLPAEQTITVTVPWPVARRWVALMQQRHRARIRRMHAAYGRRHRKGSRWMS